MHTLYSIGTIPGQARDEWLDPVPNVEDLRSTRPPRITHQLCKIRLAGICAVGVKQLHGPYKQHFTEAFFNFFPKKLSLQPKQRVNSKKASVIRIEKQVLYTAAKFSSFHRAYMLQNLFLKIALYALRGYYILFTTGGIRKKVPLTSFCRWRERK